jgi:two-component system, OmpR family, response regulator
MALILVADDNHTFAGLVGALLEDAGHEVTVAYSGLAAIASVEQHPVDAAVLDVLIPEISGDAVAQRLRQLRPGLPIALMTGGDKSFAASSGLPVLHKPFTREELLAVVEGMGISA